MKSKVIAAIAALAAIVAVIVIASPKKASPMTGSTMQPVKQLWTCGMHPQVIQDHPGNCPICHMRLVPLNTKSGGDVQIDPTVVQNMGIRTAEVMRGPIQQTVRAVGILEVPENAQHEINLKVSGWITKLYANQEGMHVHQGETLFDLYSPDVQVAEEELIGATQSLNAIDPKASNVLRADAQHMVDSARRKLRQWDIADEEIEAVAKMDKAPATVPIRNTVEGHVMDKMVVDGSAVSAGMKIMRIEDHSKLWLDVQVYQDNMAQIAIGQKVEATIDAQPGTIYTGPITFIYPHLDLSSRTVEARITIDNPVHELSPGMYATANIITTPLSNAIWVPREAIIDTGTRQIVFVVIEPGHFQPRAVRMGVVGDDDKAQILAGLASGERVVTSGQFLLDVESRTSEAINRLRQGGGEMMHSATNPSSGAMP